MVTLGRSLGPALTDRLAANFDVKENLGCHSARGAAAALVAAAEEVAERVELRGTARRRKARGAADKRKTTRPTECGGGGQAESGRLREGSGDEHGAKHGNPRPEVGLLSSSPLLLPALKKITLLYVLLTNLTAPWDGCK